MAKRQKKGCMAWQAERSYIVTTYASRNFRNFNGDPACFVRYCEMQAKFCEEDGFPAMAEQIRAAGEDAKRLRVGYRGQILED